MTTGKICQRCNTLKPLHEYSINKTNRDNYSHQCKECKAEHSRNYYKTLPGLVTRIYNGEISASKQRGHSKPSYSKQELANWLYLQGLNTLFNTWVKSNYDKNLSPSVDRITSTEGYTFNNIRLVTWKENNDAAYEERKICKRITRQCKKVEQLTLTGAHIKTYLSQAHAARDTGFCRTNINHACQGHREAAHGFLWRYV